MAELFPGKEKCFLPPAEGSKVVFLLEMQGTSLSVGICIVLEWYMNESSPFWPPSLISVKFPFINFHNVKQIVFITIISLLFSSIQCKGTVNNNDIY